MADLPSRKARKPFKIFDDSLLPDKPRTLEPSSMPDTSPNTPVAASSVAPRGTPLDTPACVMTMATGIVRAAEAGKKLARVMGMLDAVPFVAPPEMPDDLEERFLEGLKKFGPVKKKTGSKTHESGDGNGEMEFLLGAASVGERIRSKMGTEEAIAVDEAAKEKKRAKEKRRAEARKRKRAEEKKTAQDKTDTEMLYVGEPGAGDIDQDAAGQGSAKRTHVAGSEHRSGRVLEEEPMEFEKDKATESCNGTGEADYQAGSATEALRPKVKLADTQIVSRSAALVIESGDAQSPSQRKGKGKMKQVSFVPDPEHTQHSPVQGKFYSKMQEYSPSADHATNEKEKAVFPEDLAEQLSFSTTKLLGLHLGSSDDALTAPTSSAAKGHVGLQTDQNMETSTRAAQQESEQNLTREAASVPLVTVQPWSVTPNLQNAQDDVFTQAPRGSGRFIEGPDKTHGLPLITDVANMTCKTPFPGNTPDLFSTLLIWGLTMHRIYTQYPDPKRFALNPIFTVPVSPPIYDSVISLAFNDTSSEPPRALRTVCEEYGVTMFYGEVDVFTTSPPAPIAKPSAQRAELRAKTGRATPSLAALQEQLALSRLQERGARGEGRWCYLVLRGQDVPEPDEPAPYALIAWLKMGMTRMGGRVMESAESRESGVKLVRETLRFEKSGSVPLVAGYGVDVAEWKEWGEAVGRGQAEVVMWRERK